MDNIIINELSKEVIRNLMGTSVSASFVSSNLKISEEVISKFMNRELTDWRECK